MYARVARFEGGDPSRVDEQIEETRRQIAAAQSPDAPEGARTLGEKVTRYIELVDRERAEFVGIAFADTEDDIRRIHEALDQMSPGEGGGRRTSAGIYEVAIDTDVGQ